jgi:hypothetical protein
LHEFGDDRDGDLLVARAAEVQAGRHCDPVKLLARNATVGEITEHPGTAFRRPDQAQVNGARCDRALHDRLVVVTLRGYHDHGPLVRVRRGEVGAIDKVGPPAQIGGKLDERVRHGRASDNNQVGNGDDRLDVDSQRTLALAGNGHDRHAVSCQLAELVGTAEQQQPRLAGRDNVPSLAQHRRLGTGAADPAAHLAVGGEDRPRARLAGRRPLPPDHRGQRERLTAPRQLRGLFEDLPAIHSRHRQSSARTGGAPDTSRW